MATTFFFTEQFCLGHDSSQFSLECNQLHWSALHQTPHNQWWGKATICHFAFWKRTSDAKGALSDRDHVLWDVMPSPQQRLEHLYDSDCIFCMSNFYDSHLLFVKMGSLFSEICWNWTGLLCFISAAPYNLSPLYNVRFPSRGGGSLSRISISVYLAAPVRALCTQKSPCIFPPKGKIYCTEWKRGLCTWSISLSLMIKGHSFPC